MTLNESIGRFNVRKTLRFEMKPLGKTAENLDAFLAEDEERASDLHTIKTLIEAEHLALVRRVFNALPDPLPGYSEIKHSFKRDPAYPVLSGRGTASVVKAIIERCSQTRLKVPKQVRNLERWQPLFIKWHWHCLSLYTDNGENSVAREWAGRPKADVEATSRFLRGARRGLSPSATASKRTRRCGEARVHADKKTAKFFTLEAPIVIGDEFKAMVAREFRRVAYTGTMGWRQQIVRPAHEVALGIWLARLHVAHARAEKAAGRP